MSHLSSWYGPALATFVNTVACRKRITQFPIKLTTRQHDGHTVLSNLALSCLHCNGHKGPNIAGRDRRTRKLTPLFNPRRHRWQRHFKWNGPRIVGRTPIGRVTVAVLNMNDDHLVRLREELLKDALFPPVA